MLNCWNARSPLRRTTLQWICFVLCRQLLINGETGQVPHSTRGLFR
jgi:hypothetical protein